MCLAQGPQGSDTFEARTHGPSVSSQALNHWAPKFLSCFWPFVYNTFFLLNLAEHKIYPAHDC